ncbi:hypothetical protein, variant [Fonticula alba]|nr:hypothetical protein, variant [Fonticula alba]KCV67404.1 hypothetical protein, variant [Fonticula alba]|eukprot:XP_009498191.1 hypothetical protein, variant [Fonticula alba]
MSASSRLPIWLLSHGSPALYTETHLPAYNFYQQLSRTLPRQPDAIICVSAHWTENSPAVTTEDHPKQIYDFYGFPAHMYEYKYQTTGDPALAGRILGALRDAGFARAFGTSSRGHDHGTWSPLSITFPPDAAGRAPIPIVQLSLIGGYDAAEHIRLGQALQPLLEQENVLLVCSGGVVHNLRQLSFGHAAQQAPPPAPWAAAFDEYTTATLTQHTGAERERILTQHPLHQHERQAHPEADHLAPVFVAAGAAGDQPARLVHTSWVAGNLSMSSYIM